MFEVGGHYENRLGKYTVLSINEPRMTVRYDDGVEAELNLNIQLRIWGNIVAEQEARHRRTGGARRTTPLDTSFYIKPVSLVAVEEMVAPAWTERIGAPADMAAKIRPGDRLIYYALENLTFFAVATITGPAAPPTKKDSYYDRSREEQLHYFPVELDAYAQNMDASLPLNGVELDSHPDLRASLRQVDVFLAITEDEFENIADILTEYVEEEEEDEDLDELEDEEEYED